MHEKRGFRSRFIDLKNSSERAEIMTFLDREGLGFDKDTECSVVLEDCRGIVATASFGGKVIKQVAVTEALRGKGIVKTLINLIIQEMTSRNRTHALIYTPASNADTFKSLGFKVIVNIVPYIAFLEWGTESISKYVDTLRKMLIMSGNVHESVSFLMKGSENIEYHFPVLERASRNNDWVYIFNVRTGNPSSYAQDMMKKSNINTHGLGNVTVIDGKDYVFSGNFPSYFSKGDERGHLWALLDAEVFGKYIASTLKINTVYAAGNVLKNRHPSYSGITEKRLALWGIQMVDI